MAGTEVTVRSTETVIETLGVKIQELLEEEKQRLKTIEQLTPAMDDATVIKQILIASKITQSEFASRTGIDPTVISEVMHGRRKLTRKHIGSICSCFGIKADVFKF